MSNKGVGIDFKLTALVLLLGILGVSIGVLIVTLNVQDDVKVVATTEVPTEAPEDPFKPLRLWKGPAEQNKDNQMEADMWKQQAKYWTDAPLPVKQVKWFRDKSYTDDSYTVADQEAKIKTMLEQYIDNTPAVIVPWFKPNDALTMSKNDFSKLVGFAKGQFGAFPLLTNFASNDFKESDTKYTFYIDQPLPIFISDVYTDEAYPKKKPELAKDVSDDIKEAARILGIKFTDASVTAMANDVVDFDRVISRTMQQDPIVRRQYSSFCPYPGVCVNGANTQGENIADNGGIQAAYKALKAYESLNGADPRLPRFGSVFTSDQLFFLKFAQTWCDQDQNEESYKTQIKTDVHSPALYRVLGTIQNFPAFKNAFNCPANTPYTPDKHCNV